MFAECYANKDGKHDLAELRALFAKANEKSKEKHGECMTFTEEDTEMFYTEYNKLSEGEGVSLDDYHTIGKVFKILGKEMQEAMAAGQQQ